MTNLPLDQEKQRIVEETILSLGFISGDNGNTPAFVDKLRGKLSESLDALHAAVVREVEKMLDNAKKYPMRNHKGEEIYEWNQGYASALRQIITLLSAPNKDKEE